MDEQLMPPRSPEGPHRPYRMSRRKAAAGETRQRIVAAAFDLHATIGPSRTTIRAIADRAGVQRHTVYAHFPDVASLYEACTVHGIRATGMPEPDAWRDIKHPRDRLRLALTELTGWFRTNEQMLSSVLFDVDPTAPPPTGSDAFEVRMASMLEVLAAGWPVSPERRPLFDAVLGHAVAFTTWLTLAKGGLPDPEVVAVLVALVDGVASGLIVAEA